MIVFLHYFILTADYFYNQLFRIRVQSKGTQVSDRKLDKVTKLLTVTSGPPVKKYNDLVVAVTKQNEDLCPNISNARGVGALRYLLHKRYIEKGMGSGSWEEMIEGAVGENNYMKEQLVEQLALFSEVVEAVKWANYYQLDDSVIPEVVKVARDELRSQPESQQTPMLPGLPQTQATADEEDWENSCFTEKYRECLSCITKPGTIVGLDSEWKPAFLGQIQKVALLQLALRDKAYLLDLPALDKFAVDVQPVFLDENEDSDTIPKPKTENEDEDPELDSGSGSMEKGLSELPSFQKPMTGAPMSAKDLRVVVDTMLQGLGKQLRSCGVDVHITDPFADHYRAIEISRKENRIVLTSGMPYDLILGSVGAEMCYNVMCEGAKEQVVERKRQLVAQQAAEEFGSEGKDEPDNNRNSAADNNNFDQSEELVSRFLDYDIDWYTITVMSTSAALQTETVPQSMFSKVEKFYCCARCGKIFWEGSHFERVCEQFSHVLNMKPERKTVYDQLNENSI
ncbi:MUT7-like protein [Mya arenaria]|uniref:MUT7-like protein n=1 Tax=Mya arenaria TaxID=6604 RepID=A0ABY7G742_MYAAR|nr:MUT7-like protein [Mya arenaria]